MARRWVVSDGSNAQEVQTAKVAVGGVVKPIQRACVAEAGIVRQFYPPAGGLADTRISMTSTAINVSHRVIDPLDALAEIVFTRVSGQFSYTNSPFANVIDSFLNPGLDGTAGDDGKYIIKVDQVSGSTITGTLGTWIDINSAASFTWSLAQSVVGSSTAVANISVAADNGSGLPEPGTTVTKQATFLAEVTVTNKNIWSTEQRDLVEVKEAEDADCSLTMSPDGFATGSADTSGAFVENWHAQAPTASDSSGYSVKATLVSGTAPTGSALGVALSLDQVREWTLLATSGENLSCELDVEVDTIPASSAVVKRVTMNSQRTDDSATPVWTSDEWTLSDVAFPQALALVTTYTIALPAAADATGRADNASGGGIQETEAWLPVGETSSDYEVKISLVSGASGLVSHLVDVWYNLNLGQTFVIEYATTANLKTREFTISVRKIGDIAVTKTINILTAGDDGSVPP